MNKRTALSILERELRVVKGVEELAVWQQKAFIKCNCGAAIVVDPYCLLCIQPRKLIIETKGCSTPQLHVAWLMYHTKHLTQYSTVQYRIEMQILNIILYCTVLYCMWMKISS